MFNLRRARARAALLGVGAGGLLAAGVAVLAPDAVARPDETAHGVIVTGLDAVAADSGTVEGRTGSFRATGISTEKRPGYARASVKDLIVDGRALGGVTAICDQGVSRVVYGGAPQDTGRFTVTIGQGGAASVTGLTVTVVDPWGTVTQTVRAAAINCDNTATYAPEPPANGGPVQPASGQVANSTPGSGEVPKAPAPQPNPGHHPVTG